MQQQEDTQCLLTKQGDKSNETKAKQHNTGLDSQAHTREGQGGRASKQKERDERTSTLKKGVGGSKQASKLEPREEASS